ncbi:MAG: DivIVA domain-containing protein [Actinobacteria bacterium]|nr:DivIVA domain-containing protein [Actinomycetota bacterium]
MSESPQLLANVEFDIVKKGYDPEQVDNYLRLIDGQVSQLKDTARQAVEQAEVAHSRVAEAKREKAAYLSESQQAKAELEQVKVQQAEASVPAAPADADDGTEALKKMLLLAQRTADNHVEESQASAKNVVADARTKAAEIVAGAETRAERLLIEAQKVADELVRERSEKITATVSELERRRDLLRADSEVLEKYLTEHRQRLQEGVNTLAALLNDDSGLKADPMPSLKAEPDSVPPIPSAPQPALPTVDDVSPQPTVGATPSSPPSLAGPAPSEPAPRAKPDPTAPTAPSNSSPTVVRVSSGTTTAKRDPEAEFPVVKIPELLETPSEIRDRVDNDGPPTLQISAADQQKLLGEGREGRGDERGDLMPPLDPLTDEAMTRFLEEDFDENGRPRRFRRK